MLEVIGQFAHVMEGDTEQAGLQEALRRDPASSGYSVNQRLVLFHQAAPGDIDIGYVLPVALRFLALVGSRLARAASRTLPLVLGVKS